MKLLFTNMNLAFLILVAFSVPNLVRCFSSAFGALSSNASSTPSNFGALLIFFDFNGCGTAISLRYLQVKLGQKFPWHQQTDSFPIKSGYPGLTKAFNEVDTPPCDPHCVRPVVEAFLDFSEETLNGILWMLGRKEEVSVIYEHYGSQG